MENIERHRYEIGLICSKELSIGMIDDKTNFIYKDGISKKNIQFLSSALIVKLK